MSDFKINFFLGKVREFGGGVLHVSVIGPVKMNECGTFFRLPLKSDNVRNK